MKKIPSIEIDFEHFLAVSATLQIMKAIGRIHYELLCMENEATQPKWTTGGRYFRLTPWNINSYVTLGLTATRLSQNQNYLKDSSQMQNFDARQFDL